jgi:lysophospholipase L1-like esterase
VIHRRLRHFVVGMFSLWASAAFAAEPQQTPDGRITFPASAARLSGDRTQLVTPTSGPVSVTMTPGSAAEWNFKPTRWGRYDLVMNYALTGTAPEMRLVLAGQAFTFTPPVTGSSERFSNAVAARVYLPESNPFSLQVATLGQPGFTGLHLSSLTLIPAPEGGEISQAANGVITLHSGEATTHSVMMRYEPATNKNCLGYWVNPADWADWTFQVKQPGTYDVQVWQGCGTGHGGSDVLVEVGDQKFPFVVEETGHFQNFVPRTLGRVTFPAAGTYTLAIKPQRKQGGAVMDIRQIRLVPPTTAKAPPAGSRDLVTAKRVVVLGDSITYAGGWVELVETWLQLNLLEAQVQFFNLGLPSETVAGLSEPGHAGGSFPRPGLLERLDRVLAKAKPDLIIACYGMNDGIYFPLADDRFKKFQEGMRQLRSKAAHEGIRVIHVTPPVFDPLPLAGRTLPAGRTEYPSPYEGYNDVLDRYSEWLLSQRVQGWEVIDAHGPMNQFLAEQRRTNPKFILAGDGVHANEQGHWLIAREVLRHFGAPPEMLAAPTPALLLASSPRGPEVYELVKQRQNALKDPLLTAVGHQRPGMGAGKPLPEAEQAAADASAKLVSGR